MSDLDAITAQFKLLLDKARRNGYLAAIGDMTTAMETLAARMLFIEEEAAEPEPEPAPEPEPQPSVPTKVCKDCGRELPATEEFFRIHGRSGNPMQPCRECFHKSRQQPLTCSPKRPKFGTSLAERFPKCPREDCHMRKGCKLLDKPTECESFMKLHQGEE